MSRDKMDPRRLVLPMLLATFVLLALIYSVVIPLGEAPDEVPHFAYVQYLVEHRQLPTAEGLVAGESRQPPLYYLIGALATAWVSPRDFQVIANPDFVVGDLRAFNPLLHTRQESFPYSGGALVWHLVRVLSIVMGAVTVGTTARIASLIFGSDQWIAWSAAAFVAFLPEFTFLSAVVNNDNLVIMLSSLIVLQTIRMTRPGARSRDSIILGLLLGCVPFVKLSGLITWGFTAVVLFWQGFARGLWKKAVVDLARSFGIALIIFTPLAVDNLTRYGDPLGWSFMLSVTDIRQGTLTLGDWNSLARGLITSFLGRFGGALNINVPGEVYVSLSIVMLASLVGWIGLVSDARGRKMDASVHRALALFLLFWLFLTVAYLRWTFAFAGTDAGRLLFPGLPLLAIFFATGWNRIFTGQRTIGLVIWTSVLVSCTVASLIYMKTVVLPLPQEASSPPLPAGNSAPADFGNMIRVLDYRVEPPRIAPGSTINVDVKWQSLSNIRENYWLLLQLRHAGQVIVNSDGVPTAGRLTTDWWQTGQIFASRHLVTLPSDTVPGVYTLWLGLHPFGDWDWLPVRDKEMLMLEEITVVSP